eukprot:237119-Prymnesium_polylepis.1
MGSRVVTMKGEVDAIEGEADAIEGEVDAIEGEVDAIEGEVVRWQVDFFLCTWVHISFHGHDAEASDIVRGYGCEDGEHEGGSHSFQAPQTAGQAGTGIERGGSQTHQLRRRRGEKAVHGGGRGIAA